MIVIRFPNAEAKRTARASLVGRFNFKSWATGEMIVPEEAIPLLVQRGVAFTVEGPATYGQVVGLERGDKSPNLSRING